MMDEPSMQSVVLDFVKFVFHRYSPLSTPTDQQLNNALSDFRNIENKQPVKVKT